VKVLIADDDAEIQRVLSTAMWSLGFDPIAAADAMQAVMHARHSSPDVVLLDVNMPGGSGIMVLKRLKTLNVTRRIPVIVITGSEEEGLEQKVKELGAHAFLRKPLDIVALMNVLVDLATPKGAKAKAKPRFEVLPMRKKESA
jgi:CheY-like chemotaxis protein